MVIEINPLDKFTSGALFDWDSDYDVLLGHSLFEFRLHSELSYLFLIIILFLLLLLFWLMERDKFVEVVVKLEEKFINDNVRISKHSHKQIKMEERKETMNDEGGEDDNFDFSILEWYQ